MELNKKVIVRSESAGIFYGTLTSIDGNSVELINCRRIWYWEGAATISQMAMEGVNMPKECKFTMPVNEIMIFNVCEIIPCTPEAITSIENVPIWKI